MEIDFKPIGYIESVFAYKNGTPRQANICSSSKGTLSISKDVFNNPEHSLESLEHFSHLWVIFLFHKNDGTHTRAKVKPPRLNGKRVGLFSTRSPHRPNPIGLSLVKIDRVEGACIHLSGVDMLNGTPVLDIKPYIPAYDTPGPCDVSRQQDDDDVTTDQACDVSEIDVVTGSRDEDRHEMVPKDCGDDAITGNPQELQRDVKDRHATQQKQQLTSDVTEPVLLCSTDEAMVASPPDDVTLSDYCDEAPSSWLHHPPVGQLTVRFTPAAAAQLRMFSRDSASRDHRPSLLQGPRDCEQAIGAVLRADPRSTYRRQRCADRLYHFTCDVMHVTAWFDGDVAEVLKVQPLSHVTHLASAGTGSDVT